MRKNLQITVSLPPKFHLTIFRTARSVIKQGVYGNATIEWE